MSKHKVTKSILSLKDLAKFANYSYMDKLNRDPDSKKNGMDHAPREVFTGHYVPVTPTPIEKPKYITHSKIFFEELGFADEMAKSSEFIKMFTGDISNIPEPMRKIGWSTGYALSIYGNEYYAQCPFLTGNGYGDGRAISVLEVLINSKRWEMQLKGAGRTPYCRGADGRAVLRSSVREFLAQEHMYALSIPTSRSLSLYVSTTEEVKRPWYSESSTSRDPDMHISEAVAISTRVASSFIRVGQIELFARRVKEQEHPNAINELEQIVLHLIDREYENIIDKNLSMQEKIILLAKEFANRLTSLVANWIRVGYCQGNFNSDNCAAGGYTLDFGPFGFCNEYNPHYQPWTGGGHHFSFLNQTLAAKENFNMFYLSLEPLLLSNKVALNKLKKINDDFLDVMQIKMQKMWTNKLGLETYNDELLKELQKLMTQTPVDYTIFFRELSFIPNEISALKKSFYNDNISQELSTSWSKWFRTWRSLIEKSNKTNSIQEISKKMKLKNPKYTLREWMLVPAYQKANEGDYTLLKELQEVMTKPYDEQSKEIEDKYYKIKPLEFFGIGGLSHLSCSS